MTWIKTISVTEDEEVRRAVEAQRALYPIEYAEPVHPTADGETAGIVASVANQKSDNIVVFRMNKKSGRLNSTGQTVEVPAPVCLKFTAP